MEDLLGIRASRRLNPPGFSLAHPDRQIGHGYLHLLRFFLNHRRFLRSDRPERVGHSPAELLTGQTTPHWLEMLGYTRFQRD